MNRNEFVFTSFQSDLTIAINIMDAIINQNILIVFITFIKMIAIHILNTHM